MENDSENSSLYGSEEPREEDQSLYGHVELNQEEANVRKTLLECIDEIQVAGKFATGSVLETLTIPGISVDGGEPIAIPLSEEAARDLASKSDEGDGLQISAERISFQNSQWDGFVNKLVQRVVRELGVSPAPKGRKVYAKLHKHLLYKPGAIFKPHEDNERCPGVFGTLVICLPSKHKADALDKRKIWPNYEDEDDDFDIHCQKYLHHVSSLEGFKLSSQKVNVDKVLPLKSISCESDPDVRIGRQYLGSQRGDIESNAVLLIVRTDFLHAPLFNPRDPQEGPEAGHVIDKIVLDSEIQYTPEQQKKIDEAVIGLIDRFKHAKDFMFTLNVNLLHRLHKRFQKDAWRKEILNDLFSVILESAISTFDFDSYYNHGMLHIFYREALARDKGSAFKLLQQVLKNTSRVDKSTALRILTSLIKELLSLDDTDSSEVQNQLLLNAYITKAAGPKPSKPEGWARPAEARICSLECKACDELNLFLTDPKEEEITIALTAAHQRHVEEIYVYLKIGNGDREGEVRLTKTLERWNTQYHDWKSRVKAAKDKLKISFGNKYNRLTGSTTQAADKAQLTLRPKRKRGEDTDNARARTSKRARGDREMNES
ncbi:hypothetical protein ACQKWADRAFT_317583 [Trichoderma austrokoningii]